MSYLGHSTVLVEVDGVRVLTDPILRRRVGPLVRAAEPIGDGAWSAVDVVLLSHSDEQKDGDDVRERLDIQGGSKNEIYKASDAMGRLYMRNGRRVLNFSPSDTAFGKNPAGLAPIEVPDFAGDGRFLANVIEKTKAALNQMSAMQTAAAGLLDEWQIAVNECDEPEQFTAMIDQAKALDASVRDNAKKLLVKAAKAKGITFDKKAGMFLQAEAAA